MVMKNENEEFKNFVEAMCKFNYETKEGMFYAVFEMMNGIPYIELDENVKNKMREVVSKRFKDFDITNLIDTRLTEKDNKEFWDNANKSIPTDIVVFETEEDSDKISTFWMPPDYAEKQKGTPSDIFLSKTVPITDMILHFKKFSKDIEIELIFRIFLFSNWEELVDKLKDSDDIFTIPIGGIIVNYNPNMKKEKKKKTPQVAFPICISKEIDFVLILHMAYRNCTRDELKEFSIVDIHASNTMVLNAFYGVQIALLNPITETVIARSKEHPISIRKMTIGNRPKNRKIIYIRKYYIRAKDINNQIEEHRKNLRSCPLWWVIGHWRHYKNGKLVWIHGHFRGPERDKVKNMNEDQSKFIRTRILDKRSLN